VGVIDLNYGEKMKKHILAVSLLAAVSISASAEGIYVLGDVAQTKMEINVGDGYSVSKTENGFSFGVGKKINETFSAEVAYRDLLSYTVSDYDPEYDDSSKFTISAKAIQVSALAQTAISDTVSVYGRLGVGKVSIKSRDSYSWSGGEEVETYSVSKNKLLMGVGATYKFNEQFAARLEYSKFAKIEDASFSTFALGAIYSF
jgi:opacity protein-like surface antigen